MVIGLCSIPFQKSKFGEMQISSFPLSPAPTYLENLPVTRCHHTLHAKFRRGMEKPGSGGSGINMGFWCGSGDSVGSFYLKIISFNKKMSDPLKDACPLLKGFFSF